MNNKKTHLIIGSSSGIGSALASKLISEGNTVYGTYNKNAAPTGVIAQQLDVQTGYFDTDFLPDVLDGFTYCPGAIDLKPFSKLNRKGLQHDLHLQVIAAVEILQAVLPKLKRSEDASVVLFSTVAVQAGFNYHSQVAISKGAIEGLTRSLAAEFAPKIRVNAIAPSLTDTPLASQLLNNEKKRDSNAERHPLKRIGAPEDIAETAAFLLSDKSSWISGQIIHVDGGMSSIKM